MAGCHGPGGADTMTDHTEDPERKVKNIPMQSTKGRAPAGRPKEHPQGRAPAGQGNTPVACAAQGRALRRPRWPCPAGRGGI